MTRPEVSTDNSLLAALMTANGQGLQPHLQPVDLHQGQVLNEPGRPQYFAYFPTSAIVSLLYMTENGASAEIAVVGCEGMVGTALFLGGRVSTWQTSVLIGGRAWRMGAQALTDEFERSVAVRQVMLRYTQALAAQIAQTAVCNRHHAIEKQLCGWLLHGLDRLRGTEVVATHERIASMLGVRREGVTGGALRLQKAGVIRYGRGQMSVIDRAGLEAHSCECHGVIRDAYTRLTNDAALQVKPAAHAHPAAPSGGAAVGCSRSDGWPTTQAST